MGLPTRSLTLGALFRHRRTRSFMPPMHRIECHDAESSFKHSRRTRLRLVAWICAVVVLVALYAVGVERCVSYAGGSLFFVLTDGYVVVPFPDGKPRTWGDWGWWVQDPWQNGVSYAQPHELALPRIKTTRQIQSRGLHVPLSFILVVMALIPAMRRVRQRYHTISSGGLLRLAGGCLLCAFINPVAYLGLTFCHPTLASTVLMVLNATGLIVLVVACQILITSRRATRYPPGHCQTCGYNLTGNVSGICPECGTRWRAVSRNSAALVRPRR